MKQYDQAWKTIVYPEQMPYDVKDLGPFIFKLDNNIDVKRVDFAVKNIRNENIKASLFYNPKKLNRVKNQCVVFCNSRNGNRLQGKEHLFEVIKNYHYCIFDYSGSGHSDGKFCTLGQYEKDDIHAVLQFIKEKYFMNRILLWGGQWEQYLQCCTMILTKNKKPSKRG